VDVDEISADPYLDTGNRVSMRSNILAKSGFSKMMKE
jgi:hypothetical protein